MNLQRSALGALLTLTFASCGAYEETHLATTTGKADGDSWSATMVAATLASVNDATAAHFKAYQDTGIGHYFGYRSSYKGMSESQRRAFINSQKKAGTNPPMPEKISCINWVMKHLGNGYAAAGKAVRWAEIVQIMDANERDGLFLMAELKKDGWTAIYWNPDARHPIDGDPEHPHSYRRARDGYDYPDYNGIPMDDMILDFRPSPGSDTVRDLSGLRALANVPLWYGLAYGGYHTFLGMGDQLNESHSLREPNDITNVEQGPFAGLGLTSGKYNSGAILIPPGYWDPTATGGAAVTPATWVGDMCSQQSGLPQGGCGFSDNGAAASCHGFLDAITEEPRGMCKVPCAGYCNDPFSDRAETFCVADPANPGAGMCVAKPEASNGNCASIPGTAPRFRKRFVGQSGAAAITRLACVKP